MKLLLVLRPGRQRDLQAALRGGSVLRPDLIPPGYDPRVWPLALLGQQPQATWTGPAPYGLAAARAAIAEDETAYLLQPVRVADGIVEAEVELGRGRVLDLLEWLREELGGEPVQLVKGNPPLLLVAEHHVGPPALAPAPLVGRALSDLPAGPPALLARVLDATRRACLEVGGRATHLFPSSPGGPSGVQPLRESWLGLGPAAVVGGADARAVAQLLCVPHHATDAAAELDDVERLGMHCDLVVVFTEEGRPLADGDVGRHMPHVPGIAVAWAPDGTGRVPLIWLSRAARLVGDEGVDLLEPLALGKDP